MKIKNLFLVLLAVLALAFIANKQIRSLQEKPDSDLKLSIEELQKKYPIDWLENKYGNRNWCLDWNDIENVPQESDYKTEEEYKVAVEESKNYSSAQPPQNLVCSFFKKHSFQKPYKEMHFKDFSENEIKSVFVLDAKERDLREQEIIGITFKFFEEQKDSALTPEELKIKKFIFSPQILNQFKSSCRWINSEFDLQNFCSLIQNDS